MLIKRDSLGRRIPEFDRSASARKGAQTRKENHGNNDHARAGSIGGRARKRGYLGTLKDSGNEAKLKAITQKGGQTGTKYFKKLALENPEELKKVGDKGRRSRATRKRRNDSKGATK